MHSPVSSVKTFYGGHQDVYRFANGYGASVVSGSPLTYGDEAAPFELAVIKFTGQDNDEFALVYDTPITDDVLGHLTSSEVEEVLDKIENYDGRVLAHNRRQPMKRTIKRIRRSIMRRPFKGHWYYEWQIGPVVLSWKHDKTHPTQARDHIVGPLYIWLDPYWRR